MVELLRSIDFGEPDANAEYFISLRTHKEPLYLRAWNQPSISDFASFQNGGKFIITGQKGTGKTAILRHVENESKRNGYSTEFVVFKNEIIRETELLQIDNSTFDGSVIEEDKLKGNKFYYHAIKRVMISLLISKLKAIKVADEVKEKDVIERLFGTSGKEALRIAFDSILNIAQSTDVDTNKLSKGILKVDPGQLLKKSNDDLLNRTVRMASAQNAKVRLFFDEMHFAFRDKDDLRADAILVRDTVLAAQAINERFAESGIDIVVYIALRREFLDQPEIAQADIVHVIESYGEAITWEHNQAAINHPIFDFITLRFKAALGGNFSRTKLFETYLNGIDAAEIVEYTWSKPRDIVRFFKAAQSVNGNTIRINNAMFKTVLRKYSTQAWQEVKSSLGAFVPTDAIPLLEEGLKKIIPGQFDGSLRVDYKKMRDILKPAYEQAKKSGVKYNIDEFMRVMYIMGIFYYRYNDANNQTIYQQYHRGNINPTQTGEVRIHSAIAKALS